MVADGNARFYVLASITRGPIEVKGAVLPTTTKTNICLLSVEADSSPSAFILNNQTARTDAAVATIQVDSGLGYGAVVLLAVGKQHDVAVRGLPAQPEISLVFQQDVLVFCGIAHVQARGRAAKIDARL